MPRDDRAAPQPQEDAVDAALADLLAGPSPVNRIHGALDLDAGATPRASQAAVEAARSEILAALWGQGL